MSGGSTPNVVIVGGGQAGCQAAVSLRQAGFGGRISMVCEEDCLPYQRPPLSKAYIKERIPFDRLVLRSEDFYRANDIDLLLGETARSIDRGAGKVRLASGASLDFDQLVLAVGARNRAPSIQGADLDGVHMLRTAAEAESLRAALAGASRLAVIGGGFIGLEVAASARAMGVEVTVLEAAPRLMGRSVSPAIASFFLEAHRTAGIVVMLEAKVSAIIGGARPEAVETSDGKRYPCDLVLIAVGVAPNVELAEEAGLTNRDGIVVDPFMATADPRVFAVGDCTNFLSPQSGAPIRLESVENAVDQGKCAAASIVGRREPYNAVPWFWSDQASYKLQIAGITTLADHVHAVGSRETGKIVAYCFRGDRLIGIEAVNSPSEYLMGRRMLEHDVTIVRADVERRDFDFRSHVKARSG